MKMVGEELSRRTFAFSFNAGKLSLKFMADVLRYLHQQNEKERFGEQSIQRLNMKDQTITNIPISEADIKGIRRELKRFGVDFSLMKDEGKYTVHFIARDSSQIEKAIENYMAKKFRESEKPTLKDRLKAAKDKLQEAATGEIPFDKVKNKAQDVGAR